MNIPKLATYVTIRKRGKPTWKRLEVLLIKIKDKIKYTTQSTEEIRPMLEACNTSQKHRVSINNKLAILMKTPNTQMAIKKTDVRSIKVPIWIYRSARETG